MSFEQGRVYTTSLFPSAQNEEETRMSDVQDQFRKFILTFFIDNTFIYRDQLRANVPNRKFLLEVDLEHLVNFSETLAARLLNEPADIISVFEQAAKEVALRICPPNEQDPNQNDIPSIQVLFSTEHKQVTPIRELHARKISHLVVVPGIIISASSLSSKATSVQLICRNCRDLLKIDVGGGITGLQMPRICMGKSIDGGKNTCPPDPYVVVHDKSSFTDQQVLKLQEPPEMVPVGELPRHILLAVDRNLTNRAVPGTRCLVTGIYSIYQNKVKSSGGSGGTVALRNPYLRALGLKLEGGAEDRDNVEFTPEEVEEFRTMVRQPEFYETFAKSIAPSIYGHEDIKKSIACLLVGGSRRILPDGMRLRGDINVLLMGDPGTAKSQLLKFVEKVAPIAIYTSGKGSSAAGLTASVQRDNMTREFYLEGGAMVLADGGVVCIDEFDKMRDDDRVAIHEAMEQQTISIAKAGITTVLNSRTSVLAAANPVHGRYDDTRTPGQNIDFQTTILSRFDMIYVIKDQHNDDYDQRVAKHVMNTHVHGGQSVTDVEGEIPLEKMKRFIMYCRHKVAPRLGPDAAEKLASHFVEIRRNVHEHERLTNVRSSVPVTIRQLEAMIRIAESIAKLHLSPLVQQEHVDEAIRLFYASTMNAVNQDSNSQTVASEVHKIEAELKRKLRIGYSAEYSTILREFTSNRFNFSKHALDKALYALESRGTFQFRNQRQRVHRIAP